jgi:hypothetical protein
VCRNSVIQHVESWERDHSDRAVQERLLSIELAHWLVKEPEVFVAAQILLDLWHS